MRRIAVILCLSISAGNSMMAEQPPIRLSVQVQGDNGDDARVVSALSREFRKLESQSITAATSVPTDSVICD